MTWWKEVSGDLKVVSGGYCRPFLRSQYIEKMMFNPIEEVNITKERKLINTPPCLVKLPETGAKIQDFFKSVALEYCLTLYSNRALLINGFPVCCIAAPKKLQGKLRCVNRDKDYFS
jgi:hypothetical protein